jgi:hypothetical protein
MSRCWITVGLGCCPALMSRSKRNHSMWIWGRSCESPNNLNLARFWCRILRICAFAWEIEWGHLQISRECNCGVFLGAMRPSLCDDGIICWRRYPTTCAQCRLLMMDFQHAHNAAVFSRCSGEPRPRLLQPAAATTAAATTQPRGLELFAGSAQWGKAMAKRGWVV